MSNSDVSKVMGHQADPIIDAWVAKKEGRIVPGNPLVHSEAAHQAVERAAEAGSFVERLDAEIAQGKGQSR